MPPLHFRAVTAIIDLKNKNAAACRCANTRKPAQVLALPTQRPFGRTAWDIIRHSGPSCKGWFLLLYPFAPVCMRTSFLTLCRLCPAQRFCFSPGAFGGGCPRRCCGEKPEREEVQNEKTTKSSMVRQRHTVFRYSGLHRCPLPGSYGGTETHRPHRRSGLCG